MSGFQDKNINVLLVDDDKEILYVMPEELKNFVGKVIPANNGQEAMFKFSNETFHLLVTDLKMGKMDGIQLAHAARKVNSQIPILFISGSVDVYQKDIKALTNVEVITKPIDTNALQTALQNLLGAAPKKVLADEYTVVAGETLFKEGDHGDDMFFIKSGSFDVYKNINGADMFIVTLKAGELVGELSPITGQVRSATVKAKENSLVLTIPKKKLNDILDSLPKWFKILLPTIISRLNETTLALANAKNEIDKLKK